MNHTYLTEREFIAMWIVIAFIMAALGGFVIGYSMADRVRRIDEAYSPKLRPDDKPVKF